MGKLAVVGNWVKERLATLRSRAKEKAKAPDVVAPAEQVQGKAAGGAVPKARPARRYTIFGGWERNHLRITGGREARGRTLNPYAVIQATKKRAERIKVLQGKAQSGDISRKEQRELSRIGG